MRTDIIDEIAEATSRGKQWFDAAGYSFYRLPKLEDQEFEALVRRLLRKKKYAKRRDKEIAECRAYRARNREAMRALCRRWYAESKKDPKKWARRLAQWKEKDAKAKAKEPERFRARALKRTHRYRERIRSDPARYEAYKAKQREARRERYARKRAAKKPSGAPQNRGRARPGQEASARWDR